MTDKVEEKDTSSQDQAAEAAAFDASFEGSPVAVKEAPAEAAPTAPVAQATEATPPAPAATTEAAPIAPSPSESAIDELRAELRKANGRYGALNDQLQQLLKGKEAEGKPAALTPVELKRIKAEYPELAEHLEGDLADMVATLRTPATDPKQLEALVSTRVASELSVFREEAVTDRHENWKTDLWVGGELGKTRTPDYEAWLKSMTPEEGQAFEASGRPGFVIRKLDDFYKWKSDAATAAAAAKAEAEKKESRLKGAITPQGVPRAGPATISDEEAERLAFEKEFNS